MLNANEVNGPKWAIPYIRVSTEEQAKKGYSLADQTDRLRSWIDEEGYEVLEEVVDDGYSAASLVTPGIDRIRELVAVYDGVTVLTVYRDRFSREPMYRGVLEKEFAERGARIRAMDDRGDGSPEGELADAIIDQVAKYELAKTTERSKRGKIRKAREGKIVNSGTPNYGFRSDATGDYYEVDEAQMSVVRRIFRMVGLEGISTHTATIILQREGVRAPGGGKYWSKRLVKEWIQSDVYKPHTREEIENLESEGLVKSEVVACLDPDKLYGIWWYNQRRTKTERIRPNGHEPSSSGRYPKRTKTSYRERSERVAVPVPDSGIPCELVEAARATVSEYRSSSKVAGRFWELSGALMRCARCGRAMEAVDRYYRLKSGGKGLVCYYRCREGNRRKDTCDNNKSIRSDWAHNAVWEFISGLLSEPERLQKGLERMIDEERDGLRGDPVQEARLHRNELRKLDRRRSGYIDLAADGEINRQELREKLAEVDQAREKARREIKTLESRKEHLVQLEREKEVMIETYAGIVPEALQNLSAEGRHRIYKLLQLRVTAHPDKTLGVSGIFGGPDGGTLGANPNGGGSNGGSPNGSSPNIGAPNKGVSVDDATNVSGQLASTRPEVLGEDSAGWRRSGLGNIGSIPRSFHRRRRAKAGCSASRTKTPSRCS